MKYFKISILLSFLLLYSNSFSQNMISGKVYTATTGSYCKGKSSNYFYKQLEFKSDKKVKIIDFNSSIRNYNETGKTVKDNGKEYHYEIKKNTINIHGTEFNQIKIEKDKLISNRLIFYINKKTK
jgi:hypothetical protein